MSVDYLKLFGGFFDSTADAAGEIVLRYFRKNVAIDDKPDRSPVTQADREIEEKLRAMITKQFPGHGIIGEEFGRENEQAEFVWVLDPIDGTKAFISGKPLFGTIIGLLHNGKPAMGLIDQAYTRERWLGVSDQLARHNGKPIKVASPRKLNASRMISGAHTMFAGSAFEPWLKLCDTVKVSQYNVDCYAYGLVGMGCVDIVIESRLKLYDVAGAVPIVTGAGGFIGDWQGRPIGMDFDGNVIAASTKALAIEATAIMTKA